MTSRWRIAAVAAVVVVAGVVVVVSPGSVTDASDDGYDAYWLGDGEDRTFTALAGAQYVQVRLFGVASDDQEALARSVVDAIT